MATDQQMKAMGMAIDEILADVPAFRKKLDDEARAKNPHMTQAQLDASWEQLAQQFGL
jgi:hypothetical protein